MAYSIKNFAQTVTYTVNDSTANTNAVSLTLLGKSLPNYGTYFNQNFVWLMENFCSDNANPPPYPVQGQLWWDSTNKWLNVYDGSIWKTVYGNLSTINSNGKATVGNLVTTNGVFYPNGLAFNTSTYSNANVASYLPTYTGTFGTLSSLSSSGLVYGPTIGNTSSAINGNLVTANAVYAGTIGNTGATLRGTLSTAAQTNITSVGTLSSLTVNGGLTSVAQSFNSNPASVDGGRIFAIYNTNYMPGASYGPADTRIIDFGVTTGNIAYMRHSGSNGLQLYAGGNGFSFNNSLLPTANANINLGGSSSQYWNNVYAINFLGTSTTAKYADLAEKYLPDADYDVGTVMMVGGNAEVTQHDGSKVRAIGVISEYPAYKMNSDQEGGVYVALKGRVPVKVIGPVKKGQSLIGTLNGLAIAQSDDSQWMFAIALENYSENSVKLIEAVIL